ncbi:hypothetical protein SEA_LUCKYBARNES_46 [Brevibacterium phage LuckyBarnes]|uniref:DUF2815 family protein n=1 Tax=Brevibacterium phage LuckyBarnes TaxID=2027888 RepID=A0A249XNQ7_9CAUD|nr:Gp2.5-like ssDNA binding protein and ssDNA annealing protein [Brevibacterium phage LuckyBarnes]ASZ73363.1 hypothetical protein SEA_LUCKYBARNES_46 [Brevibacterium phage LuckyBarnes]
MSTKVITNPVRLSYTHILEPSVSFENGPSKYSTVILVPKDDTETIDKIKAAQKQALEDGKSTKFNGKIPANWKNTFRDGDEEADLEKNPEYAGHYFMSVSANADRRPGIVDAQLQPVMDPDQVYSGVYARVSINAFAFNTQGNKGVSFGLNNVMVLGYGDRLAGGATAEADFADFADSLL